MICDEHDERLWVPAAGDEPRCLAHTFNGLRPLLGLSEAAEEAFRAWLFDGVDRDDEGDAIDRYGRAVQLEADPGAMLAGFWRARPDHFRAQLEDYRRSAGAYRRPHPLTPAERLDCALVEIDLLAAESDVDERRIKVIRELLESLRASLRVPVVQAAARARDLLLSFAASEKMAAGAHRTSFVVAQSRLRDLLGLLEGA